MKGNKKLLWQLAFLLFLIIGTIAIVRQQRSTPYQKDTGFVFGTVYNITYQNDNNLKKEIEAELVKVDNSLSPFNKESIISKINRNENVKADQMFTDVFTLAEKISEETDGAFDITVAPLVNAWGFGFKNDVMPGKETIDSLRQFIGYKKTSFNDGYVKKDDPRIMLDCSAIAKGYACDVVANLLRSKGIDNFMVEIGGEIVTSGINDKRIPWKIGVTKPIDDTLNTNQQLQTVLNVTNKAMATSGNYRNYYYKDGKKYAHTIDPRTGYPVQHSILSSTVIAEDCMTADALATSFMVMELEEAEKFCKANPMIDAYFIYSGENGEFKTYYTDGMKRYMPDAK